MKFLNWIVHLISISTVTILLSITNLLFFPARFLCNWERPPDITTNMKKLLTVHLKNLPLRRKLAAELGLTDVLQTLSSSFDEGLLNDIARL